MERTRAFLAFSILFFAVAICSAKGWLRYVNKQRGYALNYPASWYLFDDGGGFDILNFPPNQRINGVVLKDKGAEISVTLQSKDDPQSIDDWIKLELARDQLIENRDISPAQKSPSGCQRLQQVISRSEVAERHYFIYTSLYCATTRRSVRVTLTNWEGDPSQPGYQAVAVRIANSLKVF